VILIFLTSCVEKKEELGEGLSAPELVVTDVSSGQKIDVSQFKGKVIFINFWASWCMPCREEMPSIESLYRELINTDKFTMVTILYKDDSMGASEYMRTGGYTFPVYADSDGISAKKYGVTGVPETYLVDKKGTLRKRVIGAADWSSPDARAYINTLISE
jgi:thiol-disulfide isomerase/thioredoxin